jgi:transposase
MWTNENRLRYDRSKLRYPSNLTDEEWALIAPVIPPAKRGGGKRTVSIREVVNGLMYVLSNGCQWRAIPTDLPPRSTVNGYFALWDYDGTLARTRRAAPANKGGAHRSARLRRGRENQRQEAPPPCRHTRLAAPRHRACGRYSGPRRWCPGDGHAVRHVSLPPDALCRRRLSGTAVPGRVAACRPAGQRRDREAIRFGEGVHGSTQALDCRANHRLAQPMSQARQRLGMLEPLGARFPTMVFNPNDAAKALSNLKMISDRLLDIAICAMKFCIQNK